MLSLLEELRSFGSVACDTLDPDGRRQIYIYAMNVILQLSDGCDVILDFLSQSANN